MTIVGNASDNGFEARTRAEVRDWLSAHWMPGKDRGQFLEEAVDAGWARPSWPREVFGRDLPEELSQVVAEEFAEVSAPVPGAAASAIAATVIRDFAATPELRHDALRRLLTGEYRTCLLYSEPGAGSDLA